jgi:hypothetical protein
MYFTSVVAAVSVRGRLVVAERKRPVAALTLATIRVDEFRGRTPRQPDVRPILEGIAALQGRAESPCRQQFVPPTPAALTSRFWRDQFGDDPSVSRDRDSFAGFYATDVSTQVVLQFADASGSHTHIIATCSHNRKPVQSDVAIPLTGRRA